MIACANQSGRQLTLVARFTGAASEVTLKGHHGESQLQFDSARVAQNPAISGVLRLIANEVGVGGHNNRPLLEYLFGSLFVYCTRSATSEPISKSSSSVRDVRIERAVDLINEDISKRWTVELLAKAVGLSRAGFARQFLAVLGRSPMSYLTHRRMQVAAALLFASDSGLAEVAARVGYQSEFAFNRAFRRYYQVPPGEYRLRISRSVTVRDLTRMAA